MIELNLLPPQEKEFLGLERKRRQIMLYGGSLLLTLFGFIALLGFIWFFILIQLKSYSASLQNIEASFQGQSISRQKQLIADFNQYLTRLDQIQLSHRRYSLALAELANIIPSGVRLESLTIDAKNQVNLSGFASQRTQVLMLQDALEKSALFTQVEKPLANLTKQIDINFNFKFNLNADKLTND